ncbi:MAG: hypothetical protein HQL51_15140 [Magnetococcales bacterium]|nr:hypothetical protein [Magnetococcales bacterium]
MSRVAGISEGFRSPAESNDLEWFVVGVLIIIALVLAGYLIQRHLDNERAAKYRRSRKGRES